MPGARSVEPGELSPLVGTEELPASDTKLLSSSGSSLVFPLNLEKSMQAESMRTTIRLPARHMRSHVCKGAAVFVFPRILIFSCDGEGCPPQGTASAPKMEACVGE